MSENMTNPLNSFLENEASDTGNDLFADFPFSHAQPAVPASPSETVAEAPSSSTLPTPESSQPSVFAAAMAQTPAGYPPIEIPASMVLPTQEIPLSQPSATEQFPQAETNADAGDPEDPFTAALNAAKKKSDSRLADTFAAGEAILQYGKVEEPISDRECTFEDLRVKYEGDFPELSEAKKVSWSISYGKVSKTISNPGSDKVYIIKAEIEKSKAFLDGIKKAKTDADKTPRCIVKPRVVAQSKGEVSVLPCYKDFCLSIHDAHTSAKPIVVLPSKDGRLYQMRKTDIGTFTAPVKYMSEFPELKSGFDMALPKIPNHILMSILNFFKSLSDQHRLEALVHILYDTKAQKYTIRVPQQTLSHTSVHSVMEEEYPDCLIHVMDIHSHNTMPAHFSPIDDEDEKATRLYAVVGRLDRVFPNITVRACCGGEFIYLRPADVFENNYKAFPYPTFWDNRIKLTSNKALPALHSGNRPKEACR